MFKNLNYLSLVYQMGSNSLWVVKANSSVDSSHPDQLYLSSPFYLHNTINFISIHILCTFLFLSFSGNHTAFTINSHIFLQSQNGYCQTLYQPLKQSFCWGRQDRCMRIAPNDKYHMGGEVCAY